MSTPVTGPVYLVGSPKGSALKTAVRRALGGVKGHKPRVAASYAAIGSHAEGLSFMTSMVDKLFKAEVQRFAVPGEKGGMPADGARAILDAADIVFFAGGDPVEGAKHLIDAGADAWLREARARGTSFVGVSAGSIMLGAWWATWPDNPQAVDDPFDGGSLVPCTRVVPDLVVDCHAEEDGWEELLLVQRMLAARKLSPRLVGVPNGGGVVVDGDGRLEPVGTPPYVPR
jgi:hypothetical protein